MSLSINFRMNKVIEISLHLRYDYEQKDTKNLIASILHIIIKLYYLFKFIITMKSTDICTYHWNTKDLKQKISAN